MSAPEKRGLSRRELLRCGGLGAGAVLLAACQPKVVEVEKEKIIKETVVIEGTPQVVEKVITATPAPKGPVEIVFVSTESRDAGEQLYKPLYDAFREAHPDITVNYIGIVQSGIWNEYFDKLAVMIAGGQVIDIGKIPTQGMRLAAARRLIVPLDDFIAKTPELKEYFDDVSPELAKVAVFGGKTYGLPYDFNNNVIWINTKRLKEEGLDMPPEDWTMSDYREYAKALTRRKGDEVTHYGTSFFNNVYWIDPSLFNMGLPGTMGGDTMDKPMVTDPNFVEVIQFWYDLIWKDKVCPRFDVETSANFAAGTIAMQQAGRWPLGGYLDTKFYDYEVQYWPREKDKRRFTLVGCGFWPLFTASKEKDAAWAYEAWLLRKESIRHIVMAGSNIPSIRSIGYDPEFTKWPEKTGKLWYESIDRKDIGVRSVTSPPDFSEMDAILNRQLGRIFANEAPIEATLDECQKELEAMVARRPAEWAGLF